MAEEIKESERDTYELGQILRRWTQAWSWASPQHNKAKGWYKAYRNYRDANSHAYKYNYSDPLIFIHIENIASTLINSFFDNPNPATITPREAMNMVRPDIPDEIVARQVEKAINALMTDPDRDLLPEIADFFKSLCIFGNSETLCLPEFDFEDIDPDTGPVYLGPKIVYQDYFDTFPDPRAYRWNKGRWGFLREVLSFDELKQRQKHEGYKNVDVLKNSDTIDAYSAENIHEELLSTLGLAAQREFAYDEVNNMIGILHFLVDKGHIVTIGANRVLLRDTRKPVSFDAGGQTYNMVIKPYPYEIVDDLRLWPVPKEYWGIGVAEMLKGHQDIINLFTSMRLENLELAIHKIFLANPNYDLDVDNLIFAPGNIILAPDLDRALKEMESKDVTTGAWNEVSYQEGRANDASGMLELLRGSTPSRRETATTIVQLQRAGLKRIETLLKFIGIQWFRSILKKVLLQIRTYMTPMEYMRLIGEPDAGFYRLTVKEISRFFDIMPSATSLSQLKELEQQQFLQLYQVFAQQVDIADRQELMRYATQLFLPHLRPDKFLLKEPTIPQGHTNGITPPAKSETVPAGQPGPQDIMQFIQPREGLIQ
jgi:hypothetical protein